MSKKSQEQLFYKCYIDNIVNGSNFYQSEWYKMHISAERHHLFNGCPEDVNLIDVLEMVSDWVCASLSRSGEVKPLHLDGEMLSRAVDNTVEYIKQKVVLEDYPIKKEENNINNQQGENL